MAAGGNSPPRKASEARAALALQAAREVADEIEGMRGRGRRDPRMADAVGRLSNLISLAVIEVNEAADTDLRARFGSALDQVQRKLFEVHFTQLSDQLKAIHRRATMALSEKDYRLGLAARLESAYQAVIDALIAMGGVEVLGDQLSSLEATAAALHELAEIELRVFHLVDFDEMG